MSVNEKLEDLNLSHDEVRRFKDAFKNEEFRKLFAEYAEEISDPKNKAQYEAELRQLENERGMDVKFVNPQPGHVLKTTVDGTKKAFINVCKSDIVGKPSSEKRVGDNGRAGLSWSIPHSLTPGREDVAKNGVRCMVYDFVVHSDTYRMSETNASFRKMVNDLAIEAITKQLGAALDTKNIKYPKLKYKGVPTPTVIRTRLPEGSKSDREPGDIMDKLNYPYGSDETSEEKSQRLIKELNEKAEEKKRKEAKTQNSCNGGPIPMSREDGEYAIPLYEIKHRCEVDLQNYTLSPGIRTDNRPTMLIVEVELPLLRSANPISLDIYEKKLVLKSVSPAKYFLDISLPYAVDENQGSARFDKTKRKLIVSLPVVPLGNVKLPFSGDTLPSLSADCEENAEARNDRPLIEVMSEVVNETQNSMSLADDREPVNQSESCKRESVPVTYVLPQFSTRQDSTSLTFLFNVARVKSDNASVQLLNPNSVQVKFISIGAGGFPIHYSCMLEFIAEYRLSERVNSCLLDCSEDNVVLTLSKAEDCMGLDWNSFSYGINCNSLQLGQFTTDETLSDKLDDIDETLSRASAPSDGALHEVEERKLDVTSADSKKLVLNISTKTKRSVCDGEGFIRSKRRGDVREEELLVEEDHDKTPPVIIFDPRLSSNVKPLPGILKQRSVSESSDGSAPASSYSSGASITERQVSASSSRASVSERQISISTTGGTTSDDSDDDECLLSSSGGSSTGVKKSVSFSEHIDTTLYSSNKSVSAMHAALKNKRKRARKHDQRVEQRMEKQEERRRRRSSGSISLDSGDEKIKGDDGSKQQHSNKKQRNNAVGAGASGGGIRKEDGIESSDVKSTPSSTSSATEAVSVVESDSVRETERDKEQASCADDTAMRTPHFSVGDFVSDSTDGVNMSADALSLSASVPCVSLDAPSVNVGAQSVCADASCVSAPRVSNNNASSTALNCSEPVLAGRADNAVAGAASVNDNEASVEAADNVKSESVDDKPDVTGESRAEHGGGGYGYEMKPDDERKHDDNDIANSKKILKGSDKGEWRLDNKKEMGAVKKVIIDVNETGRSMNKSEGDKVDKVKKNGEENKQKEKGVVEKEENLNKKQEKGDVKTNADGSVKKRDINKGNKKKGKGDLKMTEGDVKENVERDKRDQLSKAETVLRWEDGDKSAEHKTVCAVQFSNNVMYELDAD